MKNSLLFLAVAALVLAGCGSESNTDPKREKPNPKLEEVKQRIIAENKARMEEALHMAETPAPDAKLNPELEAGAKAIESAYEMAQTTVNASKENGGPGACSMNRQINSSVVNGEKVSTIIKSYSVTNPDGTVWHAVVEKQNGVVTKAEKIDAPVSD